MRYLFLTIVALLALFALAIATGPPGVASEFAGVATNYDCCLLVASPASLTASSATYMNTYSTPVTLANAGGTDYAMVVRQEVMPSSGRISSRPGTLASSVKYLTAYGILATGPARQIIRA